MKERVLRDSRRKEIKPKVVEGQKNLLCGKCKAYACSTDDIRIIKVCLYMEICVHELQGSQHFWTKSIGFLCGK